MIKQLIILANHLDKKGLTKEADYLDAVIKYAKKMSDKERMALTPPRDEFNRGDFLPEDVQDEINEEAEE